MLHKLKFIVITGPTAAAKSALANELFGHNSQIVIINADAIQVYQDIPIITAQPDLVTQSKIEHKLYGFVAGDEEFTVNIWLDLVKAEIKASLARGKMPVLVGGTGMYVRMLTSGFKDLPHLDLEMKAEINAEIAREGLATIYRKLCDQDQSYQQKLPATDTNRIIRAYGLLKYFSLRRSDIEAAPNRSFFAKEDYKIIYLKPEREALYRKAEARIIKMLELGAKEEVAQALGKYDDCKFLGKAIGFNEIANYLAGNCLEAEMIELWQKNTRNFIKRQFTWFNNQLLEPIALNEVDVKRVVNLLEF